MRISEIETPAIVIDLDIMERNLQRVADYARKYDLNLRPHTKTHKIPDIALMQDDLRRLPPLPQLIAQLGCAAIPIAFGVRLTTISNPLPFGPDPFNLGYLVIPITVIWIVGMINTLNWLDTMDGLAGGVALSVASA